MAFKFNFEDTFEGGLADGTYEVVIQSMTETATPSGAEHISVVLAVRNDVEQKGKNGLIFHNIWKAKATGKYNKSMINTIGKYARMSQDKEYNSLQDVFDDLVGKPLKITVKNESSEYNGKTYENLNVKRWNYTDLPNVQHEFKKKKDSPFKLEDGPVVEITEDDLPF